MILPLNYDCGSPISRSMSSSSGDLLLLTPTLLWLDRYIPAYLSYSLYIYDNAGILFLLLNLAHLTKQSYEIREGTMIC